MKLPCQIDGCDYATYNPDFLRAHEGLIHQCCSCGRAFGTPHGFTRHLNYTGHTPAAMDIAIEHSRRRRLRFRWPITLEAR